MKYIFKYLINGSLGINSKIAYKVNYGGYNAMINSETLLAKKATSFTNTFNWLKSNGSKVAHIHHEFEEEKLSSRSIYIPDNGNFYEGGYTENYDVSFVSILIEISDRTRIENGEKFKKLKFEVTELLLYFLRTHRVVTDNYYVNIPHKDKVISLEVYEVISHNLKKLSESNNNISLDTESTPNISSFNAQLKSLFIDMFIPERYKDEELVKNTDDHSLEKLIKLLQDGKSPRNWEVLFMNAKEELLIKNNYFLSVILSETAFEVYIKSVLIDICERKGIEKLQVNSMGATKNFKEVILSGSIKTLIKKHLNKLINYNIATLKEYSLWHEHTYDLRNEIVHNGTTEVTQEKASKALNNVLLFIKRINEILLNGV